MVNRIKVLDGLVSVASLSTKQQKTVNDSLEKAITAALPTTSLSDVRKLSCTGDVGILIGDALNDSTLVALSKAWEPSRKALDAEQKANLKHDLLALLNGKRQPYEMLEINLDEAQDLSGDMKDALRHNIRRIAPFSDLKKMKKKWDLHNPENLASRNELASHLLNLLDGCQLPHFSKKTTLEEFMRLSGSQKNEALAQFSERETLKQLQARIKKWDKHLTRNIGAKVSAVEHLTKLAFGDIEPTEKPTKAKKS